jgi:hypothetical protein
VIARLIQAAMWIYAKRTGQKFDKLYNHSVNIVVEDNVIYGYEMIGKGCERCDFLETYYKADMCIMRPKIPYTEEECIKYTATLKHFKANNKKYGFLDLPKHLKYCFTGEWHKHGDYTRFVCFELSAYAANFVRPKTFNYYAKTNSIDILNSKKYEKIDFNWLANSSLLCN